MYAFLCLPVFPMCLTHVFELSYKFRLDISSLFLKNAVYMTNLIIFEYFE